MTVKCVTRQAPPRSDPPLLPYNHPLGLSPGLICQSQPPFSSPTCTLLLPRILVLIICFWLTKCSDNNVLVCFIGFSFMWGAWNVISKSGSFAYWQTLWRWLWRTLKARWACSRKWSSSVARPIRAAAAMVIYHHHLLLLLLLLRHYHYSYYFPWFS